MRRMRRTKSLGQYRMHPVTALSIAIAGLIAVTARAQSDAGPGNDTAPLAAAAPAIEAPGQIPADDVERALDAREQALWEEHDAWRQKAAPVAVDAAPAALSDAVEYDAAIAAELGVPQQPDAPDGAITLERERAIR